MWQQIGSLFQRAPAEPEQRLDAVPIEMMVDAANNAEARADGWRNQVTGLGGRNDLACRNEWQHRNPLPMTTLECIYEFSAIAARVVNQEPDDSTREGFFLDGLDGVDQERLDDSLQKLDFLSKVADASRWAQLYGGAGIYMRIDDGRTADQPVDMNNIRSVLGLVVLDRYDLTVTQYDHCLGHPLMYQMSIESTHRMIHESRVLPFYGVRLPWRAQRRRSGWGGSVVDQFWDAFQAYGSSHSYLMNALARITQGVVKHKGLNKKLTSGKESKAQLTKRFQQLQRSGSSLGDYVMDMDQEDYVAVQRGVAGYKEALEAFTDYMVSNTPLPKSILMGQTPGGLNSGANAGDWETWAGYISASQAKKLTPRVRRFLDILFASTTTPLTGEAPSSYKIVWNNILQVSDGEKADIHLKNAQARGMDIQNGVVTDEQARRQEDVATEYKLTEEEIAEETPDNVRPTESDLAGMMPALESMEPANRPGALRAVGADEEQIVDVLSNG
jgi:phage-related protein (TIGR01555 family)